MKMKVDIFWKKKKFDDRPIEMHFFMIKNSFWPLSPLGSVFEYAIIFKSICVKILISCRSQNACKEITQFFKVFLVGKKGFFFSMKTFKFCKNYLKCRIIHSYSNLIMTFHYFLSLTLNIIFGWRHFKMKNFGDLWVLSLTEVKIFTVWKVTAKNFIIKEEFQKKPSKCIFDIFLYQWITNWKAVF